MLENFTASAPCGSETGKLPISDQASPVAKTTGLLNETIEALRQEIRTIERKGTEKGKPQETASGRYRLMWWDSVTQKVKAGATLETSEVADARAAHDRYRLVNQLTTQLRKLNDVYQNLLKIH